MRMEFACTANLDSFFLKWKRITNAIQLLNVSNLLVTLNEPIFNLFWNKLSTAKRTESLHSWIEDKLEKSFCAPFQFLYQIDKGLKQDFRIENLLYISGWWHLFEWKALS